MPCCLFTAAAITFEFQRLVVDAGAAAAKAHHGSRPIAALKTSDDPGGGGGDRTRLADETGGWASRVPE
ncbi:hypothetical protein PHYSODRAFT_325657 [Phytophthora sojae]|uniref:Uncharacterized protein n=1 Tax=Phytophthora sojae (strain P6497) TaxID=1094619 RepID=G4YYG3_PHYSP|nr:hypothetical protein PHYSODRAFT_325657 [Phytophthora sojae]EGZ24550.1 hypothetical protein PHYSODRAFT_325657 [Phytophthora sojae]|eukprot:XP_009519838.1 hypothetical protein PHYSODRAFT_325657 [Phytophthora sojae]